MPFGSAVDRIANLRHVAKAVAMILVIQRSIGPDRSSLPRLINGLKCSTFRDLSYETITVVIAVRPGGRVAWNITFITRHALHAGA